MKKIFLFALAIISSASLCFSQVQSKVDERFELTSIMFALAGVPEYCQCQIPSYLQDIIDDLTPYELSEPINFIRKLNHHQGIGYNAVSTTADMLEIKNGKIFLKPQYSASEVTKYDNRWNEALFTEYIKNVNKFYKLSNFHKFFTDHREIYQVAETRMNDFLAETSTEWFQSFFGKPIDSDINFYLSLSNGPNNYAVNSGIVLGLSADEEGLPTIVKDADTFLLIHEIGHHYTNPLFDAWWPQMEDAANRMFPYVETKMRTIAYGDAYTTFTEWMNNLFTLMYLKETHDRNYPLHLGQLLKSGFIWMERSTDFMDNFYNRRDLYPHIEDFMPQLVAFLNYTADNYDILITEYENRQPYITNIYPAMGTNIKGFDEIIITFSEPMLDGVWGFSGTGSEDQSVKPLYIKEVEWAEDHMSVKLLLDSQQAKDNTIYGIQLHPAAFLSSYYFHLDDRCKNLIFNTIEQ